MLKGTTPGAKPILYTLADMFCNCGMLHSCCLFRMECYLENAGREVQFTVARAVQFGS